MLDPHEADDARSVRRSRHTIPQTDLYLQRDGRRYPLSQACDAWLIPRLGTDLPTGGAEVVSVIEGHVDRWRVEVAGPLGDPGQRRVEIRGVALLAASEAA